MLDVRWANSANAAGKQTAKIEQLEFENATLARKLEEMKGKPKFIALTICLWRQVK